MKKKDNEVWKRERGCEKAGEMEERNKKERNEG